MAGAVIPGPFGDVGPPVSLVIAALDATFPGAHGYYGADADQVVELALEFDQGQLHGAIVLGNGGE